MRDGNSGGLSIAIARSAVRAGDRGSSGILGKSERPRLVLRGPDTLHVIAGPDGQSCETRQRPLSCSPPEDPFDAPNTKARPTVAVQVCKTPPSSLQRPHTIGRHDGISPPCRAQGISTLVTAGRSPAMRESPARNLQLDLPPSPLQNTPDAVSSPGTPTHRQTKRQVNVGVEGETPREIRLITPRPNHTLFGRAFFDERYQMDVKNSLNWDTHVVERDDDDDSSSPPASTSSADDNAGGDGETPSSRSDRATAQASIRDTDESSPTLTRECAAAVQNERRRIRLLVGSSSMIDTNRKTLVDIEKSEAAQDNHYSDWAVTEADSKNTEFVMHGAQQYSAAIGNTLTDDFYIAGQRPRRYSICPADAPTRASESSHSCPAQLCCHASDPVRAGEAVEVLYPLDNKWYAGRVMHIRQSDGAYGIYYPPNREQDWEAWAEWLSANEAHSRLRRKLQPKLPLKLRMKTVHTADTTRSNRTTEDLDTALDGNMQITNWTDLDSQESQIVNGRTKTVQRASKRKAKSPNSKNGAKRGKLTTVSDEEIARALQAELSGVRQRRHQPNYIV